MDPQKKLIPQNIDYYDNLVKGGYYYVDKTLLAKDCSAAVVVEVKNVKADTDEALQAAAEEALRQAIGRNYDRELRLLGYRKLHTCGIACFAKRCRILMKDPAEQSHA